MSLYPTNGGYGRPIATCTGLANTSDGEAVPPSAPLPPAPGVESSANKSSPATAPVGSLAIVVVVLSLDVLRLGPNSFTAPNMSSLSCANVFLGLLVVVDTRVTPGDSPSPGSFDSTGCSGSPGSTKPPEVNSRTLFVYKTFEFPK